MDGCLCRSPTAAMITPQSRCRWIFSQSSLRSSYLPATHS